MTAPAAPAGVHEWEYVVGGERRRSRTPLKIRAPYDDALVGITFQPDDAEIEEALQRAEAGARRMEALPSYERAAILRNISSGIEARREELTRLIAAEAGKPRKAAALEVDRAVYNVRNAAEEVQRIGHELLPLDVLPASKGRWGLVRRFPVGPVLAITPFNFPLNLVAHKLAPAIAAGNSVILKPAPQTPLTALLLAEIARNAGLPAEALSVLPCSIAQAEKLARDERLKMLSFTGSAAVGWHLKSIAGKKRVVLELGGNAGVVVHGDADLDFAAARCAQGGFAYAGQTCISVQRILVERPAFDRFAAALAERVKALEMGDPLEEKTDIGPIISRAHAERIEQWVREALEHGARLLLGGKRDGAMVEPAILTGTSAAMRVNGEEIFGPVVTVEPYDSFQEAIRRVNDSRYGLHAGVFTNAMPRIMQAFRELRTGGVIVNDVPGFRADNMPYGGTKDSGVGREGARYAIEEMTEPRILVLNLEA